ncbi:MULTISPECIES: helix-turn-helix transcriptional regulator [unclassified Brenneria]|uniref:helix-turn-helix transcriptional regulator n=1 Tax=unclassified Brenneria TaxID=2634434 RepID=UPI001C1303DA|nr:helix-turn-helix transcriptional regulator [Brenneria sp. hezel4-2-4]MEE3651594.1 helix-turn-helix transcriptional regulator [Brenneria sp. HEZEL_4_2_4]
MSIANKSPAAIAEELGERLKQARLNNDLTQSDVAELAGLSRKAVLNAEKGKVQLEALAAIMVALNLTEPLDKFLPAQDISPIQLARLQGKQRQRASGQRKSKDNQSRGDVLEW